MGALRGVGGEKWGFPFPPNICGAYKPLIGQALGSASCRAQAWPGYTKVNLMIQIEGNIPSSITFSIVPVPDPPGSRAGLEASGLGSEASGLGAWGYTRP